MGDQQQQHLSMDRVLRMYPPKPTLCGEETLATQPIRFAPSASPPPQPFGSIYLSVLPLYPIHPPDQPHTCVPYNMIHCRKIEEGESVRKLIKSYPLWANRDIGYVIMRPTALLRSSSCGPHILSTVSVRLLLLLHLLIGHTFPIHHDISLVSIADTLHPHKTTTRETILHNNNNNNRNNNKFPPSYL